MRQPKLPGEWRKTPFRSSTATAASCQAHAHLSTSRGGLRRGWRNGYVAALYDEAGIPAIVVEPVPQARRTRAGAGSNRRVRRVGRRGLPTAEPLPAAGIFDVLEHMRDKATFLARLARPVNEEGRFTLPCQRSPLLCGRRITSFLWRAFHRYTLASLRAALERGRVSRSNSSPPFLECCPP